MYIGHSTLRIAVMGFDNREPTRDELEQMKALLREAMDHGAMGLSTGLIYTPCCYAKTEEIVELAKVIRPYGGIYASHMRNESYAVVEAVRETSTSAAKPGCRCSSPSQGLRQGQLGPAKGDPPPDPRGPAGGDHGHQRSVPLRLQHDPPQRLRTPVAF